ncbi:MAG TPA: hypothetical protein VIP11_04680 [Gemmatimonadaceae bacterium]
MIHRRIYWRFALPTAILGVTILLMWRSAIADQGPTGLPNDLPNWHNRAGELGIYASFVFVEAAVALLIVRPWSYDRSRGRALGAAVLFAPWVLLNLMMLIHSGGIMVLHALWLVILWGSLLGTVLVSASVAAADRPRRSDEHAVRARSR